MIENGSKNDPFWSHVDDFLLTFFGCRALIDFGMHFGHHLASFWLQLAPFWRPLVPFGRPYGTLWLTSGYILAPLGSLLVTLAVDFLTFEGSCRHFSYIFVFSLKILCKIVFFENSHCKSDCRLPFATFPKVSFLMHVGHPLVPFWLRLAHFWFTCCSLWLTFGSRWLPFGSLLVPFGSLYVNPKGQS